MAFQAKLFTPLMRSCRSNRPTLLLSQMPPTVSPLPLVLTALIVLAGLPSAVGSPLIAGLQNKHPLSDIESGQLLIEELRCAACHEGISPRPAAPAPRLEVTAAYLNPGFVRDFIENPAAHDQGTVMPDLLGHLSEAERLEESSALAAYIGSLAPKKPEPMAEGKAEAGKALFHEVGCVACHSPRDTAAGTAELPGDIGLDHLGAKYHPNGLTHFLHLPLEARPSGRMPDMRLTPAEAASLANSLLGETKTTAADPKPAAAELIARGKELFHSRRCIACHDTDAAKEPRTNPAPAGSDLNPDRGCLSEKPGSAPNFHLTPDQRRAIQAALKSAAAKPEPASLIKMQLTQLNCIACHSRDDYGGVHPKRDSYFHSTEEALGNESRIPPPLTLVGAKLKTAWLNKVLHDGERVRPYMTTRMPLYGETALGMLTEHFSETDQLPPVTYSPPDRESAPMLRNGGHLLAGDQGLNCIACHNFNGKESPGMKGLDLTTTYQRLQPAWFEGFLRNPGQFRPGIIMPSFWPNGQAIQTEILEGDTEEQLRALWHYFSLGRSARDPSGLVAKDDQLEVESKVRTYRGRSQVAGYRGIAVGYPGGLNYAFNAQVGALTAVWQGEFVYVGWRGQGSGNFKPVDDPVQLAQDVAFLPDPAAPWPRHPVRTKEAPVNPDPTYPRQYGYSFQGYSLGQDGNPTFRYQLGDVAVTDTSEPVRPQSGQEGPEWILGRQMNFAAGEKTTLYFRALTGEITKTDDTIFRTKNLQLSLRTAPAKTRAILRPIAGKEDQQELLLELSLLPGSSTLSLDYAPLQP